MAKQGTENTDIIYNVKVNEKDGAAGVQSMIVSINSLTEANKKLREERKNLDTQSDSGKKRISEINAILDKNTAQIKHNSSALEKQRFNIGNYTGALDKLIPGLGATVQGFTAMLNPLTLGTAAIGGLLTMYLKSAAGARDLESATNKLGAAFTFLSNNIADAAGAGEGGGFLSRLADSVVLRIAGIGGLISAAIVDGAKQALKQLEIDELDVKKVAKDALRDAEELRRVRDDSTKSYEERLKAAEEVAGFISLRETVLLNQQQKKLDQLKILLSLDHNNLDLQKEVKKVTLEMGDIREDSAGKRTEAQKGINALLAEELALDQAAQKYAEDFAKNLPSAQQARLAAEKEAQMSRLQIISEGLGTELKLNTSFSEAIGQTWTSLAKKRVAVNLQANSTILSNERAVTAAFSNLLGAVGRKNKIFAAGQALINTYLGVTEIISAKSTLPSPLDWITKSFNVAATLFTGFDAIRNINKAAGGGRFMTKGPTLLMVGDNPGGREEVTVKPLSGRGQTKVSGNLVQMAGGGTLTTAPLETSIAAQRAATERGMFNLESAVRGGFRVVAFLEDFHKVNDRAVEIKERATFR
jgi:hypothetical protein